MVATPISYLPPPAVNATNLDLSKMNNAQVQTLIQQLAAHVQVTQPQAPSSSASTVTEHGIMAP